MNKSQLIVSGVAILAGGAAFVFSSDGESPPVAPAPQPLAVDNVLVATHDLS
jgi:Flp pilus assembly protein CpaB